MAEDGALFIGVAGDTLKAVRQCKHVTLFAFRADLGAAPNAIPRPIRPLN